MASNPQGAPPVRVFQDDRRCSFAPYTGKTPTTTSVMMISFNKPLLRFRVKNLETTGTELLLVGIMSAAPIDPTVNSTDGTINVAIDLCSLTAGTTSDWYEFPYGLRDGAKILLHGTSAAGVAGEDLDYQLEVVTLYETDTHA